MAISVLAIIKKWYALLLVVVDDVGGVSVVAVALDEEELAATGFL